MLRTMERGRVRAPLSSVVAVVLVLALGGALGACGGDDDGGGDGGGGGGARELKVEAGDAPPGAVDLKDTTCRFDGDRQVLASGIVRNVGDKATAYVNVSVRFVDAQGVRVDIASDSVTDLQRGESARWDASVYVDEAADDVVGCIVSTAVS
jgi:hypothetical protein